MQHLPNILTIARAILAVLFFFLLSLVADKISLRGILTQQQLILDACLVIFSLAGFTDALDGYLARRWNRISDFGRIADPFVDKITVCGAFIFLTQFNVGVHPWMTTLILAREFLVNGLRTFMEGQGYRFGSNLWGKLKTIIQFVAICLILFYCSHLQHIRWAQITQRILVWTTLVVTVMSGATYVHASIRLHRTRHTREATG